MNVERMKKIIMLLSSGRFISLDCISAETGVNARTSSTDLNELQDMLAKHGARLERKPRYGNRLLIQDEKAFQDYCRSLFLLERPDCLESSEERMEFLLRRFLYEKGYLRMEALCEEIGIGQTALSQDLKQMRSILRQYHLELKVRPHYGMQLVGTEFHKRLCLIGILIRHIDQRRHLLFSNVLDDRRKEAVKRISQVTEYVLYENRIRMSYVAMQNLTIYLMIIQERVRNGFIVQGSITEFVQNLTEDERRSARKILNRLGADENFSYPEEEIRALSLFICAYRSVQREALCAEGKQITEENAALCSSILASIREDYGCDFTQDEELLCELELHMISVLLRRQYGIAVPNPMLKEMKTRDLMGYIYGMKAAALMNPPISEDEIGYLTQYFILALERKHLEEGKKQILMISGTGNGSEKLLAYRMKKVFGNYIARLESCDITQLPYQDFSRYDCAVTTVPLYTELPVPVKQINFFMGNEDFNTLRRFLTSLHRNSMKDYMDAELFFKEEQGELMDIIGRMEAKAANICGIKTPPAQENRVIFTADTEYPVLIVHPMKSYTDRTKLVVCTLKKPAPYLGKKLSMIFMIIPQKKTDRRLMVFYKLVSLLLNNPVSLREVIKSQSYDALLKQFEQIEAGIRETAEIL